MKIKTIGNKIFISYLVLTIIILIFFMGIFNFMTYKSMYNDALDQLEIESETIARTINMNMIKTENRPSQDNLDKIRPVRMAYRLIESNILIIDANDKVVYSKLQDNLDEIIHSDLSDESFLITRKPLFDNKGRRYATLIMFLEKDALKIIKLGLQNAFILSTFASLILAFLISYFFKVNLTTPILKLKNSIKNFNPKIKNPPLVNKTGDEVEELTECFNQMAKSVSLSLEKEKIFYQNTSHELKTPLMSIQGYAEGIKDGIFDGSEKEKALDIIIGESQNLKKLVNELIYLSKIDSSPESLKLETVNLKDMFDEIKYSLSYLSEDKDVNIKILGKNDLELELDKQIFAIAIKNIITNCIRYAKSEVLVNIFDDYEITIEDDGPGFDQDDIDVIFERFYKKNSNGSGIGLAISRAVLDIHGFKVKAENRSPNGAKFTLIKMNSEK